MQFKAVERKLAALCRAAGTASTAAPTAYTALGNAARAHEPQRERSLLAKSDAGKAGPSPPTTRFLGLADSISVPFRRGGRGNLGRPRAFFRV